MYKRQTLSNRETAKASALTNFDADASSSNKKTREKSQNLLQYLYIWYYIFQVWLLKYERDVLEDEQYITKTIGKSQLTLTLTRQMHTEKADAILIKATLNKYEL